jgi:hypothetical protein
MGEQARLVEVPFRFQITDVNRECYCNEALPIPLVRTFSESSCNSLLHFGEPQQSLNWCSVRLQIAYSSSDNETIRRCCTVFAKRFSAVFFLNRDGEPEPTILSPGEREPRENASALRRLRFSDKNFKMGNLA